LSLCLGGSIGDTADAGSAAHRNEHTRHNRALLTSIDRQEELAKTDNVLLVGDFNSYEEADRILAIAAAGYVDQIAKSGTQTPVFNSMVSSLDHVFASTEANHSVSAADVRNINSVESAGFENSRFNANITNLYEVSVYRSSDHDPVILGLDLPIEGGGDRHCCGCRHDSASEAWMTRHWAVKMLQRGTHPCKCRANDRALATIGPCRRFAPLSAPSHRECTGAAA